MGDGMPWPQHAPVAELPRLIEDLPDKFPCGPKDKNKWLGLVSPFQARFGTWSLEFECFAKEFGEHGDEERCCFPGACGV